MADPTQLEFDILDSEGLEYHWWVSDVETAFVVKEYFATLTDPKNSIDNGPSDKVKANALMFLRKHIDPSLRWEYFQLKTPAELWDILKGRFGNIHDTLLPELTIQWNEIRLLDYKRVNKFNKDMLCLKVRLNFCGKDLTEDDMTQKTLFIFPTSALILANQYRLKPVGTKKVPEVNYGKMNSGKNPNGRGLDVLISTHVATRHNVERDVRVVVRVVEALLKYGEEMILLDLVPLYNTNVSGGSKMVFIRAQVTTKAPAKVEKILKKMEEVVVVNIFKPKNPYIGMCFLNTKITGDDAPGETWHMVFSTEGEVLYREGQSIGVIPDGIDKNESLTRLYSIASSALLTKLRLYFIALP
ncbi:hypothetical protein LguiA_022752 [Lonicera macranthoides]